MRIVLFTMLAIFSGATSALADAPPVPLPVDVDEVSAVDSIPVAFQVVPGLGTPMQSRVRFASFNLLASRNISVDGVEMGMVNLIDEDLAGVQMGLWNHVGRDVTGVQLGAVANWAGGHVEGLQMATGFNLAKRVTGVQLALGANIAKHIDGLQWATGGNYAVSFDGLQVGLVNVAGKGKGFMLGLVNIADELDGEALGLINVIKDGYQHLEVWTSDTDAVAVGYKLGGKSFYTLFAVGWSPYAAAEAEDHSRVSVAFGIGGHIPLAPRLGLDIDLLVSGRFDPERVLNRGFDPVVLTKLRVALGFRLFDALGIFAGVTLNNAVSFRPGIQRLAFYDMGHIGVGTDAMPRKTFGGEGAMWPGFVLGLQL